MFIVYLSLIYNSIISPALSYEHTRQYKKNVHHIDFDARNALLDPNHAYNNQSKHIIYQNDIAKNMLPKCLNINMESKGFTDRFTYHGQIIPVSKISSICGMSSSSTESELIELKMSKDDAQRTTIFDNIANVIFEVEFKNIQLDNEGNKIFLIDSQEWNTSYPSYGGDTSYCILGEYKPQNIVFVGFFEHGGSESFYHIAGIKRVGNDFIKSVININIHDAYASSIQSVEVIGNDLVVTEKRSIFGHLVNGDKAKSIDLLCVENSPELIMTYRYNLDTLPWQEHENKDKIINLDLIDPVSMSVEEKSCMQNNSTEHSMFFAYKFKQHSKIDDTRCINFCFNTAHGIFPTSTKILKDYSSCALTKQIQANVNQNVYNKIDTACKIHMIPLSSQ